METPAGAPGTEAAPGQGQEGQTSGAEAQNYAGFQTPQELATAYQSTIKEQESLKSQISNLESLKGRHGNEIGQLRQQLAQLTGQIEGMKSATPQQQGPTLQDISTALEDGKISEGQALKMAVEMTEKKLSQTISQQYRQELQKELANFKAQAEEKEAVNSFLQENPGYLEAFNSGKLDQWLQIGPNGEKSGGRAAWKEYQLQATRAELEQLKQQSAEAKKAAEESGKEKGIQLEKSKGAAAKVLNGTGGKFSQVTGNYDLKNPIQRSQAGLDVLNRMRSGA